SILVLVVLPEETRVEPARLRELRLRDDLVDRALEVLASRGIGDGAVEPELQRRPSRLSRDARGPRRSSPRAPPATGRRASGRRGCTASTAARPCPASSSDPRACRAGTNERSEGRLPRPRRRWRAAAPCPASRARAAARGRA